ncbi:HAD family hydrolase [Vibrio splendidus]|jgi:beta-phosphoglucomutase family hydrolase|uniref:Carotenoid dehydrogenase n=1 Tax=Vibrio tasmaniensis 1F-267 TaxID=1191324 RepID=A0ABX3BE74_9VIBR|nr:MULTISPECIES: beta-phosphoglucomutase family hydrolase [Vibrio]OEF53739.1 carotenoid dehydrogenase [Vibrio tasmaniensis 1F-267]OEF60623.1 carotenoid dehydrogenase [Vibrio tasmaniensis 1F-187]PMG19801.1 carotenoid dehydrogenase [Vibrio splendidus]PMN00979.1 carotenoid dehydrogenase [Vibrio splendidus]PMN77486.1 carotenoid dehydrogenase [Vibrio splendidus]
MPKLDKYKGIIFDLDGTLVNSMVAHAHAWEQTCQKFGIPYDKEWLDQLGGMPSRKVTQEILKRYDLTLDAQQITSDKIANFEAIEHKGDVIPETYALLQQQYQLKKIGIGTGAQAKHARAILKTTDIPSMIRTIVTSDDVENHKPNPDTFLKVASQLELEPSDCVVFEDTIIGQHAATSAGMDCYMVENGQITKFVPANGLEVGSGPEI